MRARLSSIEHEIAFCDGRPTEGDSGRRGNYAHVAILDDIYFQELSAHGEKFFTPKE
jgi:hypothetical protein